MCIFLQIILLLLYLSFHLSNRVVNDLFYLLSWLHLSFLYFFDVALTYTIFLKVGQMISGCRTFNLLSTTSRQVFYT